MSDSCDLDAAMVLYSFRAPFSSITKNSVDIKDRGRSVAVPPRSIDTQSLQGFKSLSASSDRDEMKIEGMERAFYRSPDAPRNRNQSRFFIEDRKCAPGLSVLPPSSERRLRSNFYNNYAEEMDGVSSGLKSYDCSNRETDFLPSMPFLLGNATLSDRETELCRRGSELMDVYSPSAAWSPSTSLRGSMNQSFREQGNESAISISDSSATEAHSTRILNSCRDSPLKHYSYSILNHMNGSTHSIAKRNSCQELMDMIPVIDPSFLQSRERLPDFLLDRKKRIRGNVVLDNCKEKNLRQEMALKRIRVQGRFVKQSPAFIPISCLQNSMTVTP